MGLEHAIKTKEPPNSTVLWKLLKAAPMVTGGALLAAAGLKSHRLVNEIIDDGHSTEVAVFRVVLIVFELVTGTWLLTGIRPATSRKVAIVLLSTFAVVALRTSISGEDSCGCFGRLAINPKYTFIFDIILLSALTLRNVCFLQYYPPSFRRPRIVATTLILLFVGVAGGLVVGSYHIGLRQYAGLTRPTSQIVLKPEAWIGDRLPILSLISLSDDLAIGRWRIVLYQENCVKCMDAITQYDHQARNHEDSLKRGQTALISVPPFSLLSPSPVPSDSPCRVGRLNASSDWFVPTPCEIVMDDGIVVSVIVGAER
jgi:hypothetical protein